MTVHKAVKIIAPIAVTLVGFYLSWNYLPTLLSQLIFVAMLVASLIFIASGNRDYILLATMTFVMLIINIGVVKGVLNNSQATLLIGFASFITIITFGSEKISSSVLVALVLAFLTTQCYSVFGYFPVSVFNKSLLTSVSFYAFWHALELIQSNQQQKLISHFSFVFLVIIVIVGSIIWSNFPQLLP